MGAIARRLAKLEAKRAKATPEEVRVIWADDGPTDEEAIARLNAQAKADSVRVRYVVLRNGDILPKPRDNRL